MPRPLRFVPTANALVEVSTRTIQSRFLLRPTRAVNLATVGVLGRGQKKYGMTVHFAVAMSNHVHLLAGLGWVPPEWRGQPRQGGDIEQSGAGR